ncbi:tyrosine-type recombinase/integrase [Grimontia marina]|nr:tyrosine-type recombinase/integrase [Grimontia marina]
MGLRPAEACQLRPEDIITKDGVLCARVTDKGAYMRVKSPHAVRDVPIHDFLKKLGFVGWMQTASQTHLYHAMPQREVDWSKPYLLRFGHTLSALGFPPGARPTAYGLRHTFIDVLKQNDINEATVADIVGHSVPSLTYGRYGKRTPLTQMQTAINSMTLPSGGAYACV